MYIKNTCLALVIISIIFTLLSCGGKSAITSKSDSSVEDLYNLTVKKYLYEPLWENRLSYDAGHALMVPLHSAFKLKKNEWINDFSLHFNQSLINDNDSLTTLHSDLILNRLHYLYLASQYILLCETNKEICFNNIEHLKLKIHNEITHYFYHKEFTWYEGQSFHGIREHILYKIDKYKKAKSNIEPYPERRYYIGISDFDLFALAILADIGSNEEKKDVINIGQQLFNTYIEIKNNLYVFQPGLWSDHPDYIYAGHSKLAAGLNPKPIIDLAEDSSHSHRIPLFIHSLSQASDRVNNSPAFRFFENTLSGLSDTFYQYVAIPSNKSPYACPVVTNFMDGRNGIYRYNYATTGEKLGYDAYSLSGILVEGWWSLHKQTNKQTNVFWSDLNKCFPLDNQILAVYIGPNTTRDRHPLVKWPEFFTNGFGELNVRLAHLLNQLG